MKKLLLLTSVLILSISVRAQVISIAEARTKNIGDVVTVSATVTNGEELGGVRYMQDGTGGIAAFGGLDAVLRNDSITITGELSDFFGLLEISPVSTFEVHGQAQNEIIPLVLTPNQIDENSEGQLIQVNQVIFNDGGGTFAANTTYGFSSNSEESTIFIRSDHPLIGEIVPVGAVTLIGLSAQHTFDGFGGYQVIPRDVDDIINNNPISIISPITINNLTTNGFTVNWLTDVESSTGFFIGTDPSNILELAFNDDSVTDHSLSISVLESGQVYYLRAFSVAGADTALSGIVAAVTVSLSSGQMIPLFNKPVNNSVANPPDNLAIFTTQIDDSIASWIDKSVVSLDIAIYNFNNTAIANAINAAFDRGVVIRIIVEGSNANIGLNFINQNIPVLERLFSDGSGMHNKFMIIDADDVDNSWIMGGSTNFTDFNMSVDFNNLIFIQDQSLARGYRVEFNEMWGGSGPQPNPGLSRFGADKLNNTPHNYIVAGNDVELYFSPSDGTTSQIINTIMDADATVDFAVLVFTRDDIADAVIDRSNDFFVSVSGLINDVDVSGSEYQNLLDNFVNVQSYQDVAGALHHKYVIIDVDSPDDDPTVLTGSHNWSSSAENSNDENTLIIHNQLIANQYYQEYSQRFNTVVVGIEEFTAENDLSAYPNPVIDYLYISDITFDNNVTIFISDVSGKTIMTTNINTTSGADIKLDLSDLDKGLYIVSLSLNNKLKTIKIIKN